MNTYYVSIQTAADALPSNIELIRKLKAKGIILDEIEDQDERGLDANVSFANTKIASAIENDGFIEISIDQDISLYCEMP